MRGAVLAALACTLACGPKRSRHLVDADAPVPWSEARLDWSRAPAVPPASGFVPPAIEQYTLTGGMRIVLVPNHRLPLVAIAAVHGAAGSREDGATPGLAALTADMLDEGAGMHVGVTFREALELAGARLDIDIATDHASMQLVTTKAQLGRSMELLADAITRPHINMPENNRVRRERVRDLEERQQWPRTVAAQIFDRVVFGAHPYAWPADGAARVVGAREMTELRAFWERAYRPDALTLIVAGDVTREEVDRLVAARFGAWAAAKHAAQPNAEAPAPPLPAFSPQLAYVDVPGAEQASVVLGRRAAAAGDTQQLAADVANSIVGGGIGSRLDRVLHDQLGLALGASASHWRGEWAGTWAAATTIRAERTLEGIRAALAVIDEARTTEPTPAELARAKQNLTRAAEQTFDTVAGTTRALARVVAQRMPLAWVTAYAQRLAAITPADVRAASTWSDLAIVVVGDWTKLGAALGELGLPVVRYDRDGTQRP